MKVSTAWVNFCPPWPYIISLTEILWNPAKACNSSLNNVENVTASRSNAVNNITRRACTLQFLWKKNNMLLEVINCSPYTLHARYEHRPLCFIVDIHYIVWLLMLHIRLHSPFFITSAVRGVAWVYSNGSGRIWMESNPWTIHCSLPPLPASFKNMASVKQLPKDFCDGPESNILIHGL